MHPKFFKSRVKSFSLAIALSAAPYFLHANDIWPPLSDQSNHPEFSEEGIARLDGAMTKLLRIAMFLGWFGSL